jgi:hypothetical protein
MQENIEAFVQRVKQQANCRHKLNFCWVHVQLKLLEKETEIKYYKEAIRSLHKYLEDMVLIGSTALDDEEKGTPWLIGFPPPLEGDRKNTDGVYGISRDGRQWWSDYEWAEHPKNPIRNKEEFIAAFVVNAAINISEGSLAHRLGTVDELMNPY